MLVSRPGKTKYRTGWSLEPVRGRNRLGFGFRLQALLDERAELADLAALLLERFQVKRFDGHPVADLRRQVVVIRLLDFRHFLGSRGYARILAELLVLLPDVVVDKGPCLEAGDGKCDMPPFTCWK